MDHNVLWQVQYYIHSTLGFSIVISTFDIVIVIVKEQPPSLCTVFTCHMIIINITIITFLIALYVTLYVIRILFNQDESYCIIITYYY